MIDKHLDNRHALLAFGHTLVPDAMNTPDRVYIRRRHDI